MSRLLAYMGNDDNLTWLALRGLVDELRLDAVAESSGVGLGWLQDGRSLLRNNPRPGADSPSFSDLMADIHSRSILGYMRDGGLEPVEPLELQPFRFRKWIFGQTGERPADAEIRASLLDAVPTFIRGNIKGRAFSEVVFHRFLSELHARNVLEQGRNNPRACADAMARTMREVESGAAVADLCTLAATERAVVAGRLGAALHYREIRGLTAAAAEPLFAGHRPKAVEHPSFKAIVVCNGAPVGDDWKEIPDRHVLWVDRSWSTQLLPINASDDDSSSDDSSSND